MLRVARRFTGLNKQSEYPHLETLIEDESYKIKDGYHYARWISPLSGLVLALGCFMPLALTVHPLFWIGTGGMTLIGGVLGWIFHRLAMQITPTQMLLRQRCMKLGQRLISLKNLLGALPILSPKVAEVLEDAAQTYLTARPGPERDLPTALLPVWNEAATKAQRALDDAMTQMLALADAETPQAQEVELGRGWALPLLDEMKATARALENSARSAQIAAQMDPATTPLATLRDARSDLERLDSAVSELDQDLRA
jgi:hypothetical protein